MPPRNTSILHPWCWILFLVLVIVSVRCQDAGAFGNGIQDIWSSSAELPVDCRAKADLAFILDSSSSVGVANFQKVLNFVVGLLQDANIDSGSVRVSLMTFSTEVTVNFPLSRYDTKSGMFAAIRSVPYVYGSTNTADGLRMLRSQVFNQANGDRPDVPNVAIIITDGLSNLNSERTIPEAVLTHSAGIHIFVVGIGLTGDTPEIQALATPPAEQNRHLVDSFDDLAAVRRQIFTKICDMVLINDPTGTSRSSISDLPVFADCSHAVDVIFLIDSSSSVGEQNFDIIRRFLSNAIQEMHIDTGHVRVAIVTFSQEVHTNFLLDRFSRKKTMLEAVLNIPYHYGTSSLRDALREVRNNVMKKRNGDRPDAPNFLIIITDGTPSIHTRQTEQEAQRLAEDKVHVMAIGVDLQGDDEERVGQIVTPPITKNLISITGFDQLSETKNRVTNSICQVARRGSQNAGKDSTDDGDDGDDDPWVDNQVINGMGAVPPATDVPFHTITSCHGQGDIVFILDSSGSVGQDNFERVKGFVAEFVRPLQIDSGNYRVGLLVYSDDGQVVFQMNRHNSTASLLVELKNVRYRYGATNTADALHRMRTQMFRPENGNREGVPDIAILLTDGVSNVNAVRTIPEARHAHSQGIAIVGVGVSLSDSRELASVVSSPSSKFMHLVDNFYDLKGFAAELLQPLCSDLDPCASRPCKHGGTCIDALDHFMCQCAEKYTGLTCADSCNEPADIIFLLDSSGSVGEDSFQHMKTFMKDIVKSIDVQSCDYRFGALKFGSSPFIQFNLFDHNNNARVLSAIDGIGYSYGFTATSDALKVVRTKMFLSEMGDRPEVRNIAVLLTDGLENVRTRGTMKEVMMASREGIQIVPIGIAVGGEHELRGMAGDPHKGVFFTPSFHQLSNITADVVDYLLEDEDQCRSNPCRHGGTCEDRIYGFICLCKPGYSGTTCNKRCKAKSDVVFLVDTSAYIVEDSFHKVKAFLISIVEKLKLYDGQSRVGIITFSGAARVERYLSEPASKADIFATINSLYYDGGYPYMPEALTMLSEEVFTVDNGDRPDVANFAILITGGMVFSEFNQPLAYEAQEQGIHVFGIGVGLSRADNEELENLVSDTDAVVDPFNPELARLNDMVDRIVARLCDDGNQCDSNPCQNAGTCVDLSHSYFCRCRDGFSGRNCERGCNAKTDLVFALDSSGSVGRENFSKLLNFVVSIVEEMNIHSEGTRVGLMTFSSKAYISFPMNRYEHLDQVKRAILTTPYRYGDTFTADALLLLREYFFTEFRGAREDVPDYAIMITDGVSNLRNGRTIPEAHRVQDEGIHIFSIGIGLTNLEEIYAISSEPSSANTFLVKDFDELYKVGPDLVSAICGDADVCAKNPCKHDGKCISRGNTYRCECAEGFSGKHCERNCNTDMDIAFLIDSSSSVTEKNFQKALDFVRAVVKPLEFASGKTRVSLVTFSGEAYARFYLDTYDTRKEILRALKYVSYYDGPCYTADALRVMREDVFKASQGDRKGAANIGILITDGVSNVLPQQTKPEAKKVRREGIQLYAIGIGIQNTKELYSLVDKKSKEDNVMVLQNYDELNELADTFLDKMCANSDDSGMVADEASILPSDTKVNSECGGQLDLVLLLDSSGSVTQTHFEKTLSFAAYLIGLLGLENDKTRVGLVTFSTESRIIFHLDSYRTPYSLAKALMATSYTPGKTNMADALHDMTTQMFQREKGDRPGVPNIGLLIADGYSSLHSPETVLEAQKARARGIQMYTVGIGIEDSDELQLIAQSKDRVFQTEDFDSLMSLASKLHQAICEGMQTAPMLDKKDQCIDDPCQNDGLCIDGDYRYTCQCLPGYHGDKCQYSVFEEKPLSDQTNDDPER